MEVSYKKVDESTMEVTEVIEPVVRTVSYDQLLQSQETLESQLQEVEQRKTFLLEQLNFTKNALLEANKIGLKSSFQLAQEVELVAAEVGETNEEINNNTNEEQINE